jgi:hypothetical protein
MKIEIRHFGGAELKHDEWTKRHVIPTTSYLDHCGWSAKYSEPLVFEMVRLARKVIPGSNWEAHKSSDLCLYLEQIGGSETDVTFNNGASMRLPNQMVGYAVSLAVLQKLGADKDKISRVLFEEKIQSINKLISDNRYQETVWRIANEIVIAD